MGLAIQNNLFGSVPEKPKAKVAPTDASVKYALFRELGKPVYRNGFGKMYLDPRPDIDDDSELWVTILVLADKIEPKLWEALLGFRCIGARLLPMEGADAYALRPHIDPSGDCGFRNQEEYRDEANRWLRPYTTQMKFLLANVKRVNSEMWGAKMGN